MLQLGRHVCREVINVCASAVKEEEKTCGVSAVGCWSQISWMNKGGKSKSRKTEWSVGAGD